MQIYATWYRWAVIRGNLKANNEDQGGGGCGFTSSLNTPSRFKETDMSTMARSSVVFTRPSLQKTLHFIPSSPHDSLRRVSDGGRSVASRSQSGSTAKTGHSQAYVKGRRPKETYWFHTQGWHRIMYTWRRRWGAYTLLYLLLLHSLPIIPCQMPLAVVEDARVFSPPCQPLQCIISC